MNLCKGLVAFTAAAVAVTAQVAEDRGASGLWQALKRAGTQARVLYVTAHPDDEDAGTLTWLARGYGADVTLYSLTRGEGGANLITGDFFQALALLRELELKKAASYYGVKVRFSSFQDFGYSKNVAETWSNWDKSKLTAELLAVIQEVKPHVLIAKFHGSPRDGHGHHTASGEVTKAAWEFSQKSAWAVPKLYTGNWTETDAWTLKVDASGYDAVIGRTYLDLALEGYRWHRSQGMDRIPGGGFQARAVRHYKLEGSRVGMLDRESDFFERVNVALTSDAAGAWRVVRDGLRLENPAASVPAIERLAAVDSREVVQELLARARGEWRPPQAASAPGAPVSVRFESDARIVPKDTTRVDVAVVVRSFSSQPIEGRLRLNTSTQPVAADFRLARDGEEKRFIFTVPAGEQVLEAAAEVGGQIHRQSIRAVTAPGLPVAYLREPARLPLRLVDVKLRPGLKIGYVMGTGDTVPDALRQIGAAVEMLTPESLATGDLSRFTTILLGIRAYAARADLRENNARLLDFVAQGGVVIVQYNTQEYDQNFGPYPYSMTMRAEEVSEEQAPVTILDPAHPLWTAPNRITASDFDGWLEQRGSKFWMTWDQRYTPMVESHDRDQSPQKGGWLEARHGKGLYIYCAYAWYRQLPAAVPGAVRIFANLVSRQP